MNEQLTPIVLAPTGAANDDILSDEEMDQVMEEAACEAMQPSRGGIPSTRE